MVLDTYDPQHDSLIFKNTFDSEETGQSKQVEVKRTDPNAPKDLFFVHIDARDMSALPSREARSKLKKHERKVAQEMLDKIEQTETQRGKNQ